MITSDPNIDKDINTFVAEPPVPQTSDPLFTIGKMADHYRVTLRALRFYESSGLLQPLRRGTTRFYNQRDRQRLEMILRGRQLGFTLAEIHDFINAANANEKSVTLESLLNSEHVMTQILSLERQREELDQAIHDLRDMYQKMSESDQAQQTTQGHSS